jgi:hypothetical protein
VDDRAVPSDDLPVLLFTRDGDLYAFENARAAARWMEPIDVIDGEYVAAYGVDGHRGEISAVRNGPVLLTLTDHVDTSDLTHRLIAIQDRNPFSADPHDPPAVAVQLLAWRRAHRWPRLPRWPQRHE